MTVFLTALGADTPPLDPTVQHARQQLLDELAKPEYQSARPTIFDDIAKWLSDFLNSLIPKGSVRGPGLGFDLGPVFIVVGVIVVLVIAFLVFGVPRLNRRSKVVGSLFGDDDARGSAELRRAGEAAAASGDYATAIVESFRAIARGLAERTVLSTYPGTTAHGFAEEAAGPFPGHAATLRAAADSFDRVRYLGAAGTEAEWVAVSALEKALRSAKPIFEDALA